jgi:hypothetical protein
LEDLPSSLVSLAIMLQYCQSLSNIINMFYLT